ncbi:bifunctional phosphoribosyl-AMP cyclohydrolase/phosphoribosyl-ATP diphosphatase HisIE [Phaeocystidibacter luteus]|uniref:Histidine biosynthesis bifunctional protein HisIE n=1 Tax=Phaeocystidibacter luteus TaxID=911197 RepID=A0A6N6RDW7_9FLAO|nr:bifunctional phosphoribosyl-AMP cyclohydrolase/phosphoribosyl-ATP diphosphatase HisIE [Phaeocystidibacter luteus]KAB2807728.1 bifunctional phosphoribosyl-AMP cyclohydrolase/phosphoribosyl-ATP diphosphatase HisIE [Phaeocystidibacter luteus]
MTINFSKGDGLVPAIVQDYYTQKVLMLGYMSEEAFTRTTETGLVTFYSRSKGRLWTKGETSGNTLQVKDVKLDCDRDTLLIQAVPNGPVCHTGSDTCFDEMNQGRFLYQLESVIQDRIDNDRADSYTNRLYKKGINKVAQKVGEEAVELVIEAKDDNDELFLNEAADLLYHTLLLLKAKNKSLGDVEKVLRERAG